MGNNWQKVQLREILSPISRLETVRPEVTYHILGAHWYAEGLYTKDIKPGSQIRAKNLYRVEQGDFVYNRLFAWKGAFAVATEENHGCYVSNEFPCFEIKSDYVDGKYLWRYFSQAKVWREVLDLSSGGTPTSRNRLKEEKLLAMEMFLPSFQEQQRIVARIEELAAKIEETRGLKEQAIEEREAFLASASEAIFEHQLGWQEAYLGDLCEKPQYGYTASATVDSIGPKFLRITDIQNGQVNWSKVPFCECQNVEKYQLKENDIVVARTGATTGKSFLIQDCPEAVFASYLIRLCAKQLVSAHYLYRYFQTPSYWQQITDEKKGTGQPNVNAQTLTKIRVPIPPISEQSRIVAYLDKLQSKVDSLKRLQDETDAELNALLPSVLDKAFKGEL